MSDLPYAADAEAPLTVEELNVNFNKLLHYLTRDHNLFDLPL